LRRLVAKKRVARRGSGAAVARVADARTHFAAIVHRAVETVVARAIVVAIDDLAGSRRRITDALLANGDL
jgi:hypothetical protein